MAFIVHAWNEVTATSIRSCFRHVPIFCKAQKELLSASNVMDKYVREAIRRTQLIITKQSEANSNAPPLDLGIEYEVVMDHSSILSNAVNTSAVGQPAESSAEPPPDLPNHQHLLALISKLLDGLRFIFRDY